MLLKHRHQHQRRLGPEAKSILTAYGLARRRLIRDGFDFIHVLRQLGIAFFLARYILRIKAGLARPATLLMMLIVARDLTRLEAFASFT